MEFGKLQCLVELALSGCSQLGCLPDSIVNLSQLKTFRLWGCNKFENWPMEFRKLESLVKLDWSDWSWLGCLPDSIVDLSQLIIIRSCECYKLENLLMEIGKFEGLVELDLYGFFVVWVFTWLNCELVTTQNISIFQVPQIGKSTNGVQETWKLGGIRFIWLFPIGVFT